ncbi:TPM domain-containing protein [Seonamhaeicola maritimus]|uniref:TPM domain-containing protein n=1 Tax=Seonamhaeicola maritimus TaxID=2591822 RepID=A0A5C7GEN1_9FLAO|nr:TPM domain-containing protein [Seonamhaeicola maritimus]TXG34705.1 TPM domain-containing protein [Seonamhaeicola maritimus]
MKKCLLFISFLTIILSCKTNSQNHLELSQSVVQDNASFFSKEEVSHLTNKIIDYEATSTNEICIFTLDSLPKNFTALQYATKIGAELEIGKKEKDNGLLILISKYDRQIGIATGNGTEKILTDDYCKQIIDIIIVSEFKNGLYYKGIDKALDSIINDWK